MEKKKQCIKCKEWKDLSEFNKCNKHKDGLQYKCRSCCKEHYIKNKEKLKIKNKEWYQKNKEELILKQKKYYEENKEEINLKSKTYREENQGKLKTKQKEYYHKNKKKILQQHIVYKKDNIEYYLKYGKKYRDTSVVYNLNLKSINELMLYEEVREASNGNVECKCTYCGCWFEPTRNQIDHRLSAINALSSGESRLYCSNGCKTSCPTYRQRIYPKGFKKATSREVQPELRQMVLLRDDYTCQKCGKHKDDLQVGLHCHHIEGIHWNPIESADVDSCVTFCKTCHVWVHKQPGCTYNDMRCLN